MRTQRRVITRLAPSVLMVAFLTVSCGSDDGKVQRQPAAPESTGSAATASDPAQVDPTGVVTTDPELESVDEDLATLDSDLQVIDDALAELDTISP